MLHPGIKFQKITKYLPTVLIKLMKARNHYRNKSQKTLLEQDITVLKLVDLQKCLENRFTFVS